MNTRCPRCHAEWPKMLRRPFHQIDCPECRAEKQRRIDYAVKRLYQEQQVEARANLARAQTMTKAELDAKLNIPDLWG